MGDLNVDWTDIGLDNAPKGGWLTGGTVHIEGTTTAIHLYAVRVKKRTEPDFQEPLDPQMEDELEKLISLVGSRCETTKIDGWPGEYVIYGLPYGD